MLIGIDLGQGAVKVTALDHRGGVLDQETEEYPTAHPFPGWSEQQPDHWVGAAGHACRRLVARLSPERPLVVKGIGLTSATHHGVLLDAAQRPLRPCIMLTDGRAVEQASRLMTSHGPLLLAHARNTATAGWTLPQLLWIAEQEPEVWARVRHLIFAKDYLRLVLTGRLTTDWIDAEGSLLLNAATRCWDPDLCRLAALPLSWLPPVVGPSDQTGWLTTEGARLLDLPEGTPVVAGCSDTAAEALAAGACAVGQAVVKLATAGNVNVITAHPMPDRDWFTYSHPVAGLAYHAIGTNAAASSQRWFRDLLGGPAAGPDYAVLDAEAGRVPPGAEGVLFHPYLLGERAPYWDPQLRASFVGLRAAHGRGHLARAIMEGVALSLADCLGVFHAHGVAIDSARIIGGGARSALWRQIVADVLGLPLVYPSLSDASAGAALLAGVGVGIYASVEDAATRTVRVLAEVEPDPRRHAGYRELLAVYRDVQQRLAPIGPTLAGVRFD